VVEAEAVIVAGEGLLAAAAAAAATAVVDVVDAVGTEVGIRALEGDEVG